MKQVLDFIKKYEKFAVFTHLNPDGDALGSAFSLASALTGLGKKADVILLEQPPIKYDFEEFHPYIVLIEEADAANYDACIAVDNADIKRLREAQLLFSSKPNMNIDHHVSNEGYAQINFVVEAPATGEIIFDIMQQLNAPFDRTAQISIYIAIATDTGNFTFSNTTPRAFEICSSLVNMGMDISFVADRVFNQRSLGATLLICKFIENMRFYMDEKLAVSTLTLKELHEAGAKLEDCETIINYARDVETVELAIFIREMKEDTYKISLRSKRYVDVSDYAGRFDGGGHKRAAGCMMCGNIHDVMQTVIKTAEEYIR